MEKLSASELAEYKEVFSMFDKDGDGTVDATELGAVMASLGVNPSETEIQEMIEEVDTDKNGTIEFDEFCNLMISKTDGSNPEEEAKTVFKSIDKDGDGFINFEDLQATAANIQWGNDRAPDEEDIRAMLKLMNSRDVMDLDTFKKIVLSE